MGSLRDLSTIFKSLKYPGNSKGGGGPYVTVSIPSNDNDLSNPLLYGTGGPDFLLRGGALLPNTIKNDVIRIGKFFTSIQGINFAGKQLLLSRLEVKTEASFGPAYAGEAFNGGLYLPINTLSQIPVTPFGVHLNKQGLDPGGFYSPLAFKAYFNVAKQNNVDNNNRLLILTDNKINQKSYSPLMEYDGGPGSIIGIGKTTIKFATRTGINAVSQTNELINWSTYLKGFKSYITGSNSTPEGIGKQFPFNTPQILTNGAGAAYNNLKPDQKLNNTTAFPSVYKSGSLEIDPENIKSEQKSWRSVGETINQGPTQNLLMRPWGNEDWKENNDIIDFYFTLVNNDTPGDGNEIIYFPAYIDQLGDSLSALWTPEKYLGRGEDFWTYGGFDRNISLAFKVYARNRDLINIMYENLNKLSSTLLPDYSPNGFMRGNVTKLTIGKYIENLPGIITNLNYSVPMDNSWDIDIEVQLPFYIEVNTFSFKPIHNFLAKKGEKLIARSL